MTTVCFDSTMLMLLLEAEEREYRHPDTGEPVERVQDRVRYLVKTAEDEKQVIVVPTPALSELLVGAGRATAAYLTALRGPRFQVRPFDQLAAIENARIEREARLETDKRDGSDAAWQKVKFDRQNVAIAKVHSCERFYTADRGIEPHAGRVGIQVVYLWDLPLPPADSQVQLDLRPPPDDDDDPTEAR